MELSNIFELNKRLIKECSQPINLKLIKKGLANKNNILMLELVSQLSNFYEEKLLKKIYSFEINKNEIKLVEINNETEFEKSLFSSDLFSVFVGPFDYKNKFIKDNIHRILIQSNSSIFFAQLYPFKIIENTTNYGLKKVS